MTNENKEAKTHILNGLKSFFKDVPFYHMFEEDRVDQLSVGWLNGPQNVLVKVFVEDLYKEHDIPFSGAKYKRLFNLKGAEFVSKLWNETMSNNGFYDAVGHKEVDVPLSISKTGKAYIPAFRDDFNGFKNDDNRKFNVMLLNSVASVSEPDKKEFIDENFERYKERNKNFILTL